MLEEDWVDSTEENRKVNNGVVRIIQHFKDN